MLAPSELDIARYVPSAGCSTEQAQRYTRWLAINHYENFNVVSWLLPRRLHQHFCDVYAYCRWADDLGDEVRDPARALELLDWWDGELVACYDGHPAHAVFVALAETIRACDIPIEPFRDLLVAFRQDQTVKRYATWGEVLGYCRYSAEPVGRLVLYLCGYRDAERQRFSDDTCTALQLANFWQDVSRDLEKGRIYIPLDALAAHGLTESEIVTRQFDERYIALMKDLLARTRELFASGFALAQTLDSSLRIDIEMFSRGGLAVLRAIEAIGYNTLQQRPAIGRIAQMRLLGRALASRLLLRGPKNQTGPVVPTTTESAASPGALARSYSECHGVVRAAASNFYYAFYLLPSAKRDALAALYAFMRLVDDVADEAGDVASKQRGLARWRAALEAAVTGSGGGEHPVLPALVDTLGKYKIPARYLHDLISGAEMDLTVSSYATFDRLREYCYRVAGTVGLNCVHVFGFREARALDLAEKLGLAFQLTNIIRDVASDYAIGRVYLPEEDLRRFGVLPEELAGKAITPALRELLRFEADRAWHFYREGAELISLVEPESRAALWGLVRTYSTLLGRIEARGYDVVSRVRLSFADKMYIWGFARLGRCTQTNVFEKRDSDRRGIGRLVGGRRAG
ncbi:MAG TPA: squalene synthase HpnC [Candidatus Dormibacteraeota bacterium]|nr:squalene synthase HpnC [Candidatus Dormibacteraeota bacterium]